MKKTLSILAIFWVFNLSSSYSQNWLPLSVNKTHHFSCDTTNTVFSLWIDSVSVINSDTIYYTNRFILPCDTCDSANYPNIYATKFLLKNQPLFLSREIVKTNNLLKLISPDSISISLLLNVNDTWIFDSTANQSATVYYKGLGQILGIEDSIYCFKLDNSDTIIISKNYGIVQFPCDSGGYYRLIGIEGTDTIGYHIPGFYEIYDFPNGAVFQIAEYEGNPEYYHTVYRTLKIIDKITNTDNTFNYKASYCIFVDHCSFAPNDCYTIFDTLENIYNPYFFESEYPINYFNYPIIKFRSYQDTLYSFNQAYYIVNIYIINGITYFEQKPTQFFKLNEIYEYSYAHPDILVDCCGFTEDTHGILIIEKTGLMYNDLFGFEHEQRIITENYNLNNDSTGLQCSCCIVSVDKVISKTTTQIYYNEGYIYINGIESGVIELFSLIGQKLQVNNFKGVEKSQTFVFKLNNNRASGIYFIKVTSNNKCETIKLLISG